MTRVVWADREWRSDAADAGWTPYSTCATSRATRDDARCGRSAMQIALGWAGATGRTSYWTGSVAPEDFGPCRPADLSWAEQYRGPRADPCPAYPAPHAPAGATARDRALVAWSGARVGAGTKGAAARAVQGALRVKATGSFTSADATKLRSWQRRHDLPATGAADTGTWRALLGTTLSVPMVTSALPASTMPTSSPTGWRRIYSQDFLTTAPIGSFTAARKDDWYLQTTNPYARSLRSYPDGWGTTGNLSLNYASKTVDVVDQDHGAAGVFRLNAKTDTVDGRRRSLAGSFFAVLDPTASGNAQVAQTYGRYSVRFRTVGGYPANHAGPGYGSAFLLWPADDTWNNGEVDFPEMAWGNKIGGFVHTIGNPSVNATVMTSTVPTDDTWHVATIEWKPTALVFSIDGTVLQTVTQNVPNKPFRWGFQSGGHDGTPADGVTGQLLVDWITIDAWDPTATTSALPASTMPTSSPTGWRRIYSQDFLTTAPIGSFTAARKDDWYLQTTNPYARSLRSYPDGWGTTGNLSLNYASKTVDVVDQDHGAAGVFRLNAKTDTVDGRRRSLAGSFFAVLDPTASGNAQVAQTYGRYSVRFRTVGGYPANHAGPGYGSAFLLWPADDTWNNGEVDFPEMAWGNKIGGFVHTIGNPSVNATVMTSTVPTDDTWHVATIEWKPTALVFSIDGTVLQTVTQNVPNKPFRWGFQSGGHDGTPADGVTGQLLVDWITIDAYAGKV